ncbi:MAG TPA: metallopeptidase TldD-related protein [Acidisarcina sp.]
MLTCLVLSLGTTRIAAGQSAQAANPLIDALTAELARAMSSLGKPLAPIPVAAAAPAAGAAAPENPQPPYFISYAVDDVHAATITAQYGGLLASESNHVRLADVVVRVGDPKLDNTHGERHGSAVQTISLPLGDDRNAIERSLWWATNSDYANALQTYQQIKTETEVRAKEEDTSADFSVERASTNIGSAAPTAVFDRAAWEGRMKALSATFRSYPNIDSNFAAFLVQDETSYFVSSEGARLIHPHIAARVAIVATTRADDGMDLFRVKTFEAESPDRLPDLDTMQASVRELGTSLEALRKAPVTEPFSGPAILSGRAAAVFFHEVLGHRLEGQRQRGNEEGQTFTKELGKPILPSFLSVVDDPTQRTFENTWLGGSYAYDDEGQRAQRVSLVESGVLKTFLMSRMPIASVSQSNGHGRSQTGRMPTGRQGNLIVTSTSTVPEAELRKMLIAEAKKQGKPYGLYFEDISSGFAVTTRDAPQAFSVMPLVVYRVYVDGRPDELVRGVSIVGTPQTVLSHIVVTSDRREVFNGECGAESGTIPVSAVAPAMLISEIETERKAQGNARPPILPAPGQSIASAKIVEAR